MTFYQHYEKDATETIEFIRETGLVDKKHAVKNVLDIDEFFETLKHIFRYKSPKKLIQDLEYLPANKYSDTPKAKSIHLQEIPLTSDWEVKFPLDSKSKNNEEVRFVKKTGIVHK